MGRYRRPHFASRVRQDKMKNMRATTLWFALTFALLGTSAHANNSDENKYICFDPTKYQGSKTVSVSGQADNTCDNFINLLQTPGNDLASITFDTTFDATTASTDAKSWIEQFGEQLKCCSDGKSALYKDHKYFCKDPAEWLPDKKYTGPETSNTEIACRAWVEGDDDTKTEDFTKSWSCDGKSAAIKIDVQDLGAAVMGCCGSGKKSACWVDRSNVCADPSKFLPWNNFKSEDGSFDGTCDFAVHTISKDNTASCHGEDFSQTWSCSGKSSSCQVQLLELARGGCCGSAGQSASACHGHYSGAGSVKQVCIFAISIAVAIALA